jgi:cysteine-rich repeat protein
MGRPAVTESRRLAAGKEGAEVMKRAGFTFLMALLGSIAVSIGCGGGDSTPADDGSTDSDTGADTDADADADGDADDGGGPECGNGVVEAGENCDDGNTVDTDACLSTCVAASCGDGFVQAGVEDCDDGNTANTDTCLGTCVAASCGDGFVQAGVEDCDDGNTVDTDACLGTCVAASCGDGFVQAGVEDCDNGADNSDTAPDACRTSCENPACGDGVVDAGESCDDGNTVDTDACRNDCSVPTCGDGRLDAGEECDSGTANSDTTPDACRTTCVNASCGDAVADTVEACDDGNTVDTDACLSTCVVASCGDGFVQAGVEACDDGNTVNTDACLSTCVVASCGDGIVYTGVEECDDGTANSDTVPDACRTTCVSASCGDGVVDAGEACDDGNTIDTDACNNSCVCPDLGGLYSYSRSSTSETAPTTFNTSSKVDASLVTAIGLTGVGQVTAAAFDPTTGVLYATHGGGGCCPVAGYAGCLLTTDLATGATTVVGCDPVFGSHDNLAGLAVSSTGQVYGMLLAYNAGPRDAQMHLVSLDKATGAITLIGTTAGWNRGHGMAFGPGDVLYYQNNADGFGTVDLTTGAFTAIGNTFVGFPAGGSAVTDMAYDEATGTMYAAVAVPSGPTSLATVDLATGTFTYVGTFPSATASIAIRNACY